MTDKQKNEICAIVENGGTSKNVYDYCMKQKIPRNEIIPFLVEKAAPNCKECKHIAEFPCHFPCAECERVPRRNFFERNDV